MFVDGDFATGFSSWQIVQWWRTKQSTRPTSSKNSTRRIRSFSRRWSLAGPHFPITKKKRPWPSSTHVWPKMLLYHTRCSHTAQKRSQVGRNHLWTVQRTALTKQFGYQGPPITKDIMNRLNAIFSIGNQTPTYLMRADDCLAASLLLNVPQPNLKPDWI